MKNLILKAVIAALIVASLFLLTRSCGLTEKYKLAKDDYIELKKITEADHALSLTHIEELNNEIGQANKTIVKLNGDITVKNTKITLLSKQLADIVGQEPPTTPEIETMPIVLSLRAQVQTLSNLYSISVDIINEKDKVIDLWSKKFGAEVTINETLRTMYDKEHALRVNCDALLRSLEGTVHRQLSWGRVKSSAIVVACGIIVYGLVKK